MVSSFARFLAVIVLVGLPACSSSEPRPSSQPAPPPGQPETEAGAGPSPMGSAPAPGECGAGRAAEPGVVLTESGPVRGTTDDGLSIYRGIPYAKPPVGTLRWRAPEPPACASETIEATTVAAACTQVGPNGTTIGREDCLTLDIWAPSPTTVKRPVLFYLHGGDNVIGKGGDYDGSTLATRGPAVVVTINYRLNVFGWLAHPAFAKENAHGAAGNYALLDQIAALKWVKTNIERFGGDPERVLLFGQSAGATNTCALLASPLAKGLFSRALMQSGNCTALPAETIRATADNTTAALGCDDASDVAACLRTRPAEEVLRVPGAGTSDVSVTSKYYPVVDGYSLVTEPQKALESGTHNHVPLVAGTTEDEYMNVLEEFVTTPLTNETEYLTALVQIFGADGGAAVATAYPAASYPSPREAMAAVFGDMAQHCPTRRALRAARASQTEPVHRYLFAYDFPSPPLSLVGAAHGLDVVFFWNDFPFVKHTPTAVETALAYQMIDFLLGFAETGDPTSRGLPSPIYLAATDPYVRFDQNITTGSMFRAAECDFWDAVSAAQ